MKNKYLLYILLFIFVLSIGNFIYHYINSTKVNIGDANNTINRVVKFIESTTVAEGFTKWKVVGNSAEIPSSNEDRNQPEKYKDIIRPPVIDRNGNNQEVILYAWTPDMGLLTEWSLVLENEERIVNLSINVIDTAVGSFDNARTEGFVPTPGVTLVNEPTNILLP